MEVISYKKGLTREDFLKSFANLEGSFQDTLLQARKLDRRFEDSFDSFTSGVRTQLERAEKDLSSSEKNPLSSQILAMMKALSETNDLWRSKLEKKEKGLEFREKFSDSLLVFVYGKVKSGKSSLGNYIAWGKTDNCNAEQQNVEEHLQPKYFSEARTDVKGGDKEKEAETNRAFRVGATEATSSIQGFQLPGITWVDSPGLHSYNDENGRLAKQYVEHADLVIYTMSSASPGRQSDLEEIDKLFGQSKKLVVLITGSDTTEETCDDDDEYGESIEIITVMKPESDRDMQRQYVEKAISQLQSHNHAEILSVSARYAELHPNNEKAMQDSGFSELFEMLIRISQEEGVQIKRRTPLRNFQVFLKDCTAELLPYTKLVNQLKESVIKVSQNLEHSAQINLQKAKRELDSIIEASYYDLSDQVNKNGEESDNSALINEYLKKNQQSLDKRASEIALKYLQNVFAEVMKELQSDLISAWSSADFDLPKYDVEKIEKKITSGYNSGSRKVTTGVGALIGGGLGLFFGGIGSAIGSTVGGYIGSKLGSDGEVVTKNIELIVGDNLIDIQNKTIHSYNELLIEFFDKEASSIQKGFIDKMNKIVLNVEKEVNTMRQNLQGLSHAADEIIEKGK